MKFKQGLVIFIVHLLVFTQSSAQQLSNSTTMPSVQRANTLFYQNQYQAAADEFRAIHKSKIKMSATEEQGLLENWGYSLYKLSKKDSALIIYTALLNFPNVVPSKKVMAYAFIGRIKYDLGDTETAINYLEKGVTLNEKQKLSNDRIYSFLWLVYSNKGDFNKALSYAITGYNTALKYNNKRGIVMALGDIADTYFYKNEYVKARENYSKAIRIIETENFEDIKSSFYQAVANTYQSKEEQEIRSYYISRAIEIDKKQKNYSSLAYIYLNLAIDASFKKNIDGVYKYHKEVESLLTYCSLADVVTLTLSKGTNLLNIEKYKEAQEVLENAVRLAQKSNQKDNERMAYQYLSEVMKMQNNYKKAFDYLNKYNRLSDSINILESEKYNKELLQKYEVAEKEKELTKHKLKLTQQEFKTQRWILITLSMLFVCLILIGLFVYYRNRYQLKMTQAFNEIYEKVTVLQNELSVTNLQHTNTAKAKTSSSVVQIVQTLASLETQMVQKFKESNSFNSLVSHELRHNLKQIENRLKAFEQDSKDEDKSAIQQSIKNISQLDNLVNRLLSLAKLENEPLFKTTCSFNDIVADVVAEQLLPPNCDIQVAALPTLSVDVLLMKQVVHNLLSNAIKYASLKPTIRITILAETIGALVTIKIIDNGVGFDPNQKEYLYKPFHRLHSDLEGMGVGLIVVKTIIEKHGGSVFAENNQTEGATFGFTLPL